MADGIANSGFVVGPNWSTGTLQVAMGPPGGATAAAVNYTRPGAAAWQHYTVTLDRSAAAASGIALYLNGAALSGSVSSSGTPGGTFANSTLWWMCRNGSSLFGAGRLSDVRLYGGRFLGPAEAWSLYEQSLRGHPDTLRRYANRSWFFPVEQATGTFQPAWARHCNQFFGPGIWTP